MKHITNKFLMSAACVLSLYAVNVEGMNSNNQIIAEIDMANRIVTFQCGNRSLVHNIDYQTLAFQIGNQSLVHDAINRTFTFQAGDRSLVYQIPAQNANGNDATRS